MGLVRRNNGVFYIRMRIDGQNVKISLKTKNEKLANEFYQVFLLDHMKSRLSKSVIPLSIHYPHPYPGTTVKEEKSPKPLRPLYQRYLSACQAQKFTKQTLAMKDKLQEILAKFKIRHFEDFTQENMTLLLEYFEKNYTNDSIRKFIAEIKAFLNYAIKQGEFERVQYDRLTFPSIVTKCRDEIISQEDYKKIEAELILKKETDFLYYLKFLWFMGCRPNEAVHVRLQDIDFQNRSVGIFQNKTKKQKTSFIPQVFSNDLSDYINEHGIADALFHGHTQGYEFYSKKFSKVKTRLGLNPRYSLYTFRHTFSTNLLNATGDLHLVSKSLGHSDVSITAKHYANRKPADFREKIDQSFDAMDGLSNPV